MDFHTHPHPAKSKLPSLAVAIGAHAIMLWIALQAVQVINRPEKHIVDFIPVNEPEPPKPIEPKIEPKMDKTLPPPVFVAPPENPIIERADLSGLTGVTQVKPNNTDYTPNERTEVTTVTSTPHTPVHIAANVDARACDKPEYPLSSLRTGEEGTVHLAMLIGTDGHVIESKVEKSSGSRALDKAAIQGLSLCKFKPGTTDGVAEKSWAKLQYVWSIN